MKHTITLDKETNIASVKIVGFGDDETARQFIAAANNVLTANEDRKIDAIIDMEESGDSTIDGVKLYQKFITDDRLGKLAFVKTGPVIHALVQLATKDKDPGEVNFFDSVEEAHKWITKEK